MKIVIQSNCGPYGLSRKAIEKMCSIIPQAIISQIDKLIVVSNPWMQESFEYDEETKVAHFAFRGDSSLEEVRHAALTEFLLGLGRIEVRDKFGVALSEKKREKFTPFVDEWYLKCLRAIEDCDSKNTQK